uniref:NAC domain-containing protein 8 n=1 Tax=Noccaea caerulescens TaxID=107243 RepID=A0A1J3EKL8_NOCCA
MYKMCHEPINISPAESGVTFHELNHLPLTRRRILLQSSESVSQRIPASVPASNVDSVVKSEEDCFSETCVVSNCGASESTRISCSQGADDSENLRPQNNTLVCCSNDKESFNRVEQTEETTTSDALEHLTLKERRKMLLARMALRSPESTLEDNSKDCNESDLYEIKAEISCKDAIASSSGIRFNGFLKKIDSYLFKKISIGSDSESKFSGIQESDIPIAHERSFELSSIDYEHSPLNGNGYAAAAEKPRNSVKRVKRNHLPLDVSEIKVESLDDCVVENNDERNPVTSEQVHVKGEVEEAHDEDELDCAKLSYRLNHCTSAPNLPRFVKNEAETASELDEEDEIDHMKLIDRLKLRSFRGSSGHHEDPNSPSSGFSFCASDEYVKPLKILRPWKRKKTATDSIETALEEDAPGLLQMLIQQGVSVDELRLYGENASGCDSSDDSLLEESFSELEDVISQLFYKRETGVKLLNLRSSKASRTSYCLTCLFSLIEQARYLRFRKWPVEWGWCRDLQSFIFVFERHNRIVMERPEYGYATYFFELSSTASIGWQIRRLVLAMKLASCGRYQLIENKPLLVGEDMTEGEAEVLMKYGWVTNTGLGTMLNYRDRVFHDRKTHKETSEWRSKISKLLVDGYNSGTIVSTFIAHHDNVDDVDVDDGGLDIGDVKLEPY